MARASDEVVEEYRWLRTFNKTDERIAAELGYQLRTLRQILRRAQNTQQAANGGSGCATSTL